MMFNELLYNWMIIVRLLILDALDTSIPMPGVECDQQQVTIFIRSVENHVVVLPTKTKPKKFIFYGSDGKRYDAVFHLMDVSFT